MIKQILGVVSMLLSSQNNIGRLPCYSINYNHVNAFVEGYQNSTAEYINYIYDTNTNTYVKSDYAPYTADATNYSYNATLTINDTTTYEHMIVYLLPLNAGEPITCDLTYDNFNVVIKTNYLLNHNYSTNIWQCVDVSTQITYTAIVATTYATLSSNSYNSNYRYFLLNDNYGNYSYVRNEAYQSGYTEGYNYGNQIGYDVGLAEGQISSNGVAYVFTWLKNSFNTMATWLDYQILPNISIGLLVSVPLIVGVIFFIINFFKGEG